MEIQLDFMIRHWDEVRHALLFNEAGRLVAEAHGGEQRLASAQQLALLLGKSANDALCHALFAQQPGLCDVWIESHGQWIALTSLPQNHALALIVGPNSNIGLLMVQLRQWKSQLAPSLSS